MSKFVVAGIIQIETIVKVDHIPIQYSPVTSVPDTIFTSAGGDAFNESLAFSWLGDKVELLSVVGRNQDMSIFNPNDREVTLNTDYILPIIDNTPTQVVLYDKDRKEQIFEDIKGLREAEYRMSMVPPMVAACDMVVLSNANFCRPFIQSAKEFDKKIAVNIHTYLPEKEKYNVDFLENASILYFSDDTIKGDPFDFVRGIADKYNTDIIILGQGSKGLILFDRHKDINVHYDTVKTNEVVNTTGAGNALFACFLHYYQETGDSQLAIKNAMLFASYKIGYMGTSNGFMTVEQLEQWGNLIWGSGRPGI
ncbi:MAG: carbohydrate kinase family protein [Lachnospiraceae bacterium]|nr:carbohydrate kinase family protein [Lachnospiraceae bacterium]MBR1876748.1 carbohydrate kinase family protein [Lachnospiraceae bacterium]